MTYEEFSKLWDGVFSAQRVGAPKELWIDHGMTPRTEAALIAYANGDKSAFDRVRKILDAKENQ